MLAKGKRTARTGAHSDFNGAKKGKKKKGRFLLAEKETHETQREGGKKEGEEPLLATTVFCVPNGVPASALGVPKNWFYHSLSLECRGGGGPTI